MKKYYFLIFSLFFLSISAQNDLENIKKKYGSIKSYSLNYKLIVSMNSPDDDDLFREMARMGFTRERMLN